jgi:hypothetical protein
MSIGEAVAHSRGCRPTNVLTMHRTEAEMKSFNQIMGLFATGLVFLCLATGIAWSKGGGNGGDGQGGGHSGGAAHQSGGGGGRGASGGNRGPSQQAAPRVAERQTYSQPSQPSGGGTAKQQSAPQQAGPKEQGGNQRQTFFRGPEGGDRNDSDGSRVEDFLNGNGSNRNGRGDGDFRNRFTDRDSSDRNGDNFRRNADSIRRDFRDRNRNDLPFQFGWWDNHRFDRGFGPWGFTFWRDRPWFWWGSATVGVLDPLFGWDRPYYWDYGPNGYVYYQDDQFYRNGQPYMAANEYYQQVYNLAHSAPALSQEEAAKSDWMPLGVFAVTAEGKQDEQRMIQLAVSKQGVLSGTYYNQGNNGAHPLQGMVDQKTHRAAWYFADGTNDQMVFETSIDNLTEPQSTVMVHFAPRSVGVWQIVRLERPEASDRASAGPTPAQGKAESAQPAQPTQPQQELP